MSCLCGECAGDGFDMFPHREEESPQGTCKGVSTVGVDTSTERVEWYVSHNLDPAYGAGQLLRALVEERDTLRSQMMTERRLRMEDAASHMDDQGVTAKALKVLRQERDILTVRVTELEETAHYANEVAELAIKHRDIAEQELIAALASPAQEPTK